VTAKQKAAWTLSEKKWFLLGLAVTLLAAWGLAAYLGMAQTPMASRDLTPARQPEAWHFSLADGTAVTPDQAGKLALPQGTDTLYCTTSLEGLEGLTPSALLALDSRSCDVAVLADGTLLADLSHRFDPATGTFPEPTGQPAGGGLVTLGAAKTLTLAVQFLTPEAALELLPSVTVYPESMAYQSVHLTAGAKAALPAGLFLAAALALTVLFLCQLYQKKYNGDVLLLALAALSFCLLDTLPFGIYVVWFLQTPFVTYTLRLLPTLMILWILWYRWEGKLRRFGWLLPLACTLAVVGGILWRTFDMISGNAFTNLLQGKLLPLAMGVALLLCLWQAVRGSQSYRRFFSVGAGLAALTALASLVSFLRDGGWWASLAAAFRNTALLGYFEPLQLVNQFLVILLLLLAFYDFIMGIVRQKAEVQTLTLQNRYAAEHADHLRQALDDTRAMRHEVQHHLQALRAFCETGDLARIRDYVDALGRDHFSDPIRYSDHPLVNALVTSCGQQARELSAEFEASIQVPEQMDISDTDLAVILSNMIDNALEALAKVPDGKDRRLQLKAAIFEETGLFVSCTNTFAGKLKPDSAGGYLTTKEGEGHGLGMMAMERVAEKYNSILLTEVTEDTFHVKTYLYFK